MNYYMRCVGVGLAAGFGVFAFYVLRVIYVIQINHRWRDLRQL